MPQYACPLGCERNGKPIPIETIRGWKKHMTRQHGQWSEDQLQAAIGAQAPDPEKGRSLFLAELGGSDTPGQEGNNGGEKTADTADSAQGPTAASPEPKTKTVPFKSKKLRKFLSSMPEVFLKAKGIEPDADDKEMIDTATEMLEEMFGVAFEVPESMWVIKSRWLALLFPLGAMLLVWAKHEFSIKLQIGDKKPAETETQNV